MIKLLHDCTFCNEFNNIFNITQNVAEINEV